MSEAWEQYLTLLDELRAAREKGCSDEKEDAFTDRFDVLWDRLTADEQREVELHWKRAWPQRFEAYLRERVRRVN